MIKSGYIHFYHINTTNRNAKRTIHPNNKVKYTLECIFCTNINKNAWVAFDDRWREGVWELFSFIIIWTCIRFGIGRMYSCGAEFSMIVGRRPRIPNRLAATNIVYCGIVCRSTVGYLKFLVKWKLSVKCLYTYICTYILWLWTRHTHISLYTFCMRASMQCSCLYYYCNLYRGFTSIIRNIATTKQIASEFYIGLLTISCIQSTPDNGTETYYIYVLLNTRTIVYTWDTFGVWVIVCGRVTGMRAV